MSRLLLKTRLLPGPSRPQTRPQRPLNRPLAIRRPAPAPCRYRGRNGADGSGGDDAPADGAAAAAGPPLQQQHEAAPQDPNHWGPRSGKDGGPSGPSEGAEGRSAASTEPFAGSGGDAGGGGGIAMPPPAQAEGQTESSSDLQRAADATEATTAAPSWRDGVDGSPRATETSHAPRRPASHWLTLEGAQRRRRSDFDTHPLRRTSSGAGGLSPAEGKTPLTSAPAVSSSEDYPGGGGWWPLRRAGDAARAAWASATRGSREMAAASAAAAAAGAAEEADETRTTGIAGATAPPSSPAPGSSVGVDDGSSKAASAAGADPQQQQQGLPVVPLAPTLPSTLAAAKRAVSGQLIGRNGAVTEGDGSASAGGQSKGLPPPPAPAPPAVQPSAESDRARRLAACHPAGASTAAPAAATEEDATPPPSLPQPAADRSLLGRAAAALFGGASSTTTDTVAPAAISKVPSAMSLQPLEEKPQVEEERTGFQGAAPARCDSSGWGGATEGALGDLLDISVSQTDACVRLGTAHLSDPVLMLLRLPRLAVAQERLRAAQAALWRPLEILLGRVALVGVVSEQLKEHLLPTHPDVYEQASASPLQPFAALLAVALLTSARTWLSGGAARSRRWEEDKGRAEGRVVVNRTDLWVGRVAMLYFLWLLVVER